MLSDVEDVLPKEQLPRCSKCEMTVERFLMEVSGGRVYFVAICHRAIDVTSFTLEEFDELKEVSFGLAFAGPLSIPF
jgi:hypothetical protein